MGRGKCTTGRLSRDRAASGLQTALSELSAHIGPPATVSSLSYVTIVAVEVDVALAFPPEGMLRRHRRGNRFTSPPFVEPSRSETRTGERNEDATWDATSLPPRP